MRKTIFIVALASLYLLGCVDNNRKEFPTLKEEDAVKMSAKYYELIADTIKYVIRYITMDQKQLRKFTAGSERVKLVAAGYLKPRIDEATKDTLYTTIIIQIGTREDGKSVYTYYDFRDVFKSIPKRPEEDGENNTICPPPDNCDFPPLIQK